MSILGATGARAETLFKQKIFRCCTLRGQRILESTIPSYYVKRLALLEKGDAQEIGGASLTKRISFWQQNP
jgi:hypothetical protein